jgi:hypothetical protein
MLGQKGLVEEAAQLVAARKQNEQEEEPRERRYTLQRYTASDLPCSAKDTF